MHGPAPGAEAVREDTGGAELKLKIEQSPACQEVEITVRCAQMDARLASLLEQIRLYGFSVAGLRDGRSYQVLLDEVLYIETVEEKTFLYRSGDVLECQSRLYELEEQLRGTSFVRVSRSCLLNLRRLESVSPQFDGRFEARMENGETVVVNRHYVKGFKQRFGL